MAIAKSLQMNSTSSSIGFIDGFTWKLVSQTLKIIKNNFYLVHKYFSLLPTWYIQFKRLYVLEKEIITNVIGLIKHKIDLPVDNVPSFFFGHLMKK